MKSVLIFVALFIAQVRSECANACNGHGKCTSYDMCICNRNWQANDCSERVCQFGLAHVDTPKGDLDMNGEISGPYDPVVDNSFTYPYGTTEQFPQMEDSQLNTLDESAHYYMECSNKGSCDRASGTCSCYDGYEGVACQRASCPNACSGHGVCMSKKQLASADSSNHYYLWDKDSTMGCSCDAGYYGADCSLRQCKSGVDPLYLDDSATIKYSTWDFAILTTSSNIDFTDGTPLEGTPYYSIRFYDSTGEDWLTAPIAALTSTTCDDIVAAFEALPNNVIPSGYTYCTMTTAESQLEQDLWANYDAQHPKVNQNLHNHPQYIFYQMALWEAQTNWDVIAGAKEEVINSFPNSYDSYQVAPGKDQALDVLGNAIDAQRKLGVSSSATQLLGMIYRVKFYGNPGALKQPEIEIYLDGNRPSITSPNGKLITKVWTDGQQGESNDYFADHCNGVTATLYTADGTTATYLSGLSPAEKLLLKACLGDSDFDNANNQEVYNWDKGNQNYPHLIKLVKTTAVYTDGGYYAALWYDESADIFRLVNPIIPPDWLETDNYEIYTTKGTLALTSNYSNVQFGFGSNYLYMTNTSYDLAGTAYDGDLSCEVGLNNAGKFQYIQHCLNKTDLITFLTWDNPQYNPPHINLYTVDRLQQLPYSFNQDEVFGTDSLSSAHFMTHVISLDIATNWGAAATGGLHQNFYVYKFFPSAKSTYNYVAECSNRGICDETSGICKCFPGYTNDDCSVQNAISL